ncbi:MAG: ATPase, T2SS/T4P/T4SS family [Thermodesulfobacteriota bacterium]
MTTNTAAKKSASTRLAATVKDQSGAGHLRLGGLLRKHGLLTAAQLERATEKARRTGLRLSFVLTHAGMVDDEAIARCLNTHYRFPMAELGRWRPSPEVLRCLPLAEACRYLALPFHISGNVLSVAMTDPGDTEAVEMLRLICRKQLAVHVAPLRDIVAGYRSGYGISDEEYRRMLPPETTAAGEEVQHRPPPEPAAPSPADRTTAMPLSLHREEISCGASDDPPAVRLVDSLLRRAVEIGASDIHLEPGESALKVRYRIDGAMHSDAGLAGDMKNSVISRIKILANLNITERRLPQDGCIRLAMPGDRTVEFRVSTLPVLHGERVVLRLLDRQAFTAALGKLGLSAPALQTVRRIIHRPQGMVLVTGPTGSGKTVTLYSILNELNSSDINILTVEDPVESALAGISQASVQPETGFTFASALRSFLRQDPDVIMVGEIRDRETAETAVKAAMTGHRVLSTLHTNDAPSTVTRMTDIGIPGSLIASSLSMVLAQRLGRRLCPHCKRPAAIDRERLRAAGLDPRHLAGLRPHEAAGCPRCRGVGYRGRIGFFELLEITAAASRMIGGDFCEDGLRRLAIGQGMQPLRLAALEKVKCGVTSLDEALRRTPDCDGVSPLAAGAGGVAAAADFPAERQPNRLRQERAPAIAIHGSGGQALFGPLGPGRTTATHAMMA